MIADSGFDVELTSRFLHESGQRAGFLALAGLLGGFLFIRTSARLMRSPRVPWWPGSVETSGGLHIHHLVWGIVTVLLTGFIAFAVQPHGFWLDLTAVLFGIGAGLTLDEFALWLHLEDVYWSQEGRQSIDAMVVAVTLGGLIVTGAAPFDTGDGSSITTIAGLVAVNLCFVVLAAYKGKPFAALCGVFIPVVAIVAAVRLAKPGSRWAARRYPPGSRKLAAATEHHARGDARRQRVFDAVGGAPSSDDP